MSEFELVLEQALIYTHPHTILPTHTGLCIRSQCLILSREKSHVVLCFYWIQTSITYIPKAFGPSPRQSAYYYSAHSWLLSLLLQSALLVIASATR